MLVRECNERCVVLRLDEIIGRGLPKSVEYNPGREAFSQTSFVDQPVGLGIAAD